MQIGSLSDPMERLKLIVSCLVLNRSESNETRNDRGNRRGPAMSREHLRLAECRPDDLQSALSPLITLIAEQLRAGMAVGSVRHSHAERMAVLVYNLVSTTVQTELLTQKSANPDRARTVQLAADIWEFCQRAIAA